MALPWGQVTSVHSTVAPNIKDYVRLLGVEPCRDEGSVDDQIWMDDGPVAQAPAGSQFALSRPLESGSAYDRRCRWCLVDRENRKPGTLVPVYYGVALDEVESPHLPAGARVLLAADGMQTDLAGERLVETPQLEAFLRECGEHFEPLRRACAAARAAGYGERTVG